MLGRCHVLTYKSSCTHVLFNCEMCRFNVQSLLTFFQLVPLCVWFQPGLMASMNQNGFRWIRRNQPASTCIQDHFLALRHSWSQRRSQHDTSYSLHQRPPSATLPCGFVQHAPETRNCLPAFSCQVGRWQKNSDLSIDTAWMWLLDCMQKLQISAIVPRFVEFCSR